MKRKMTAPCNEEARPGAHIKPMTSVISVLALPKRQLRLRAASAPIIRARPRACSSVELSSPLQLIGPRGYGFARAISSRSLPQNKRFAHARGALQFLISFPIRMTSSSGGFVITRKTVIPPVTVTPSVRFGSRIDSLAYRGAIGS